MAPSVSNVVQSLSVSTSDAAPHTQSSIHYSLEELQKRDDVVFLGTRIGCKIDGRVVNNSLYSILKEKIAGTSLCFYLLEKYHWTTAIFADIDWDAHLKVLKKHRTLNG